MSPTAFKFDRDLQYTCEMKSKDQQIHKQITSVIPTIVITPPDADQRVNSQIRREMPTIVITPPQCDQLIHKQITLAVPSIVITHPMHGYTHTCSANPQTNISRSTYHCHYFSKE